MTWESISIHNPSSVKPLLWWRPHLEVSHRSETTVAPFLVLFSKVTPNEPSQLTKQNNTNKWKCKNLVSITHELFTRTDCQKLYWKKTPGEMTKIIYVVKWTIFIFKFRFLLLTKFGDLSKRMGDDRDIKVVQVFVLHLRRKSSSLPY